VRLALIDVLDRIGDADAAAVFRHCAVYDSLAEVREACAGVLQSWSSDAGARGERARAALARVQIQRARGEGPLPER